MNLAGALQKLTAEVHRCLPFTANADQENAVGRMAEFVLGDDPRALFILKGYAGTGKTNLVSALTQALPVVKWRSVLLAPTGRAAKVFSSYSRRPAFTIHKKIFRQGANPEGAMSFSLADNLHRNTLFIVDEASMIGAGSDDTGMNGSLLENLFEYVFSGDNCKLLLVGDTAQLPPVGSDLSPALDREYLKNAFYLNIIETEMREVARQRLESGILFNATSLRNSMMTSPVVFPGLRCAPDVTRISGAELEEALYREKREFGEDNLIIITRSNKQAGNYNKSYRHLIRQYEEDLNSGDKLMVVRNNYFWLEGQNGEAGFIANGDMAEITRINRREELYGFHFCDCSLRFQDYPNMAEQQVKLLTDCLYTDHPALRQEEQRTLYQNVLEDVADVPQRYMKMAYVRKSPYYNALQVKFSYAITCHKAQGGQWPVVFIDQGYIKEESPGLDYMRWLYTALTRASEKVYLVNFDDKMMS